MSANQSDSGDGWPSAARRRGHPVVYVVAAVLAAGAGAGLTAAFTGHGSKPPASVSARDVPSSQNPLSSGAPLDQAAVKRAVEPGLVDITAALTYRSETAEGTGMILSAN